MQALRRAVWEVHRKRLLVENYIVLTRLLLLDAQRRIAKIRER
jgi:hypothetical protein